MVTDFGFDFGPADDDFVASTTVAWQKEMGGAWSRTHETRDRGLTTLCGQAVPESAVTDSTSSMGHCKRCLLAKTEAK